jgi:hypothetical protein
MPANAAPAPARKRSLLHVFILLLALLLAASPPATAPAAAKAKAKHHQLKKAKKSKKSKQRRRKAKQQAAPARDAQIFGINGGGLFQRPESEWAPVLEQFAAGGLGYVRQDLSWSGVQRERGGPFDWSQTDRVAAALARAGLRWYPLLAYSSTWSGVSKGDVMSHPADAADYLAFVSAAVDRYGNGGSFWREHSELPVLAPTRWEIWNEPNTRTFWREQATAPEDYADLYAAARATVHQHDPQAQAIAAGLVEWGAGPFLTRFYAHRPDLRGQVDALGFHPYNRTAGDQLQTIRDLRVQLNRLDPGVPLELSEAGFSTTEMTEAVRATAFARLVKTIRSDRRLGVRALLPYAAMSQEAEPGNWGQWLGIWNANGTPKPSATAYLASVAAPLK